MSTRTQKKPTPRRANIMVLCNRIKSRSLSVFRFFSPSTLFSLCSCEAITIFLLLLFIVKQSKQIYHYLIIIHSLYVQQFKLERVRFNNREWNLPFWPWVPIVSIVVCVYLCRLIYELHFQFRCNNNNNSNISTAIANCIHYR